MIEWHRLKSAWIIARAEAEAAQHKLDQAFERYLDGEGLPPTDRMQEKVAKLFLREGASRKAMDEYIKQRSS